MQARLIASIHDHLRTHVSLEYTKIHLLPGANFSQFNLSWFLLDELRNYKLNLINNHEAKLESSKKRPAGSAN